MGKRNNQPTKKPSSIPKINRIHELVSEKFNLNKSESKNSQEIPTHNYIIIENITDYDKSNDQDELTRLVAELVLGIWKTRQKIVLEGTNVAPEEFKKIFRPLDATYQKMLQSGIEIADRVEEQYKDGMIEHVLTFEPREDLYQDTILETIKPTILYKEKVILTGEIIVGKAGREKNIKRKNNIKQES